MNTITNQTQYININQIMAKANITDKDLITIIPLAVTETQNAIEKDIILFNGVIEAHFYLYNGSKNILHFKPNVFDPANFNKEIAMLKKNAKDSKAHTLIVMDTAKLGDTGQDFVYVVIFNKTHQLIFTKAFYFNPDENTVKFSEWNYMVHPIRKHIINPDYRNIIAQ